MCDIVDYNSLVSLSPVIALSREDVISILDSANHIKHNVWGLYPEA
jgi:hypothetical protein